MRTSAAAAATLLRAASGQDVLALPPAAAEAAETPSVEDELYSDVFVNIQPNLSPTRDYIHGSKNPLL